MKGRFRLRAPSPAPCRAPSPAARVPGSPHSFCLRSVLQFPFRRGEGNESSLPPGGLQLCFHPPVLLKRFAVIAQRADLRRRWSCSPVPLPALVLACGAPVLQRVTSRQGPARPEEAQSTERRQRLCQPRPGPSHIPRHTEGTSGVTQVGSEPRERGTG